MNLVLVIMQFKLFIFLNLVYQLWMLCFQTADIVNSSDDNGNPALHVACENNDVRMVQLLMKVGAKHSLLNDAGIK